MAKANTKNPKLKPRKVKPRVKAGTEAGRSIKEVSDTNVQRLKTKHYN